MKILTSFLAFIICLGAVGQKELATGTKIPEIVFQESYPAGYKIPKNKPMILDFWATWCGPCVAGLLESNPYIEKYSDQIDYVAITDNSSVNVEAFIKKKNLKHQFVVDKTEKTFENFGVTGIPHAYLIDQDRIIRWQGHAQSLTEDIIAEFLETGDVKPKAKTKPVQNVKKIENKDLKKGQPKSFSLIINELPVPDFDYSISMPYEIDTGTISFIFNLQPLQDIISHLNQSNSNRVIFKGMSAADLNKKVSLQYSSNVENKEVREFLLENLALVYSLKISRQQIDTATLVISVADKNKLEKYKTVMTTKNGIAAGSGGKYSSGLRADKTVTLLNYSISDLANSIEPMFGEIARTDDSEDAGYDFENLDGTSVDTLKGMLLEKYGVRLDSKPQKIEFLIVERGH